MRASTGRDLVSAGWNLIMAAVALTGLTWQMVLIAQGVNVLVDEHGALPSHTTRIIRFLSFFTVESNLLVAGTALFLVLRPAYDGALWRVLRLSALFGITVTGVVYSTLLRGVVDLHGAAAVTNAMVHYVVPAMAVLGWLLFGPRPRITDNTLLISLVWPVLYVAWTLVHGAQSGWYPYPMVNVAVLGYVTAIRNGIGLSLLLIGVGALYLWLDRHLPPAPDSAQERAGDNWSKQ